MTPQVVLASNNAKKLAAYRRELAAEVLPA